MIGLMKRESVQAKGRRETICQWLVECPETDKLAEVKFSAPGDTFTTAQELLIRNCSFWPETEGCQQKCLKSHTMSFA